MKKRTAKTIAISTAGALLLTGCAVEYLNPDGRCADLTTTQYPELYYDYGSESADVYFEVETDGDYEGLHAYVAYPEHNRLAELEGAAPGDPFYDFIESLDDDTVAVDRVSSGATFEVTEGNPHRVSLGTEEVGILLVEYGLSTPVAVFANCDNDGYVSALPSASPTGDPVEIDLPLTEAKTFYPGYAANYFEVAFAGANQIEVKLAGRDEGYTNVVVLPWVSEFGDIEQATFEQAWYASMIGVISAVQGSFIEGVTASSSASATEHLVQINGDIINPEFFQSWIENGYLFADMEEPQLDGALILTVAGIDLGGGVGQVRFSYEFARFGADGTIVEAEPSERNSTNYSGPQYNDSLLKGEPGGQVTITGANMMVNSATIGGKTARIVSNSATSLTLEIPADLTAGRYDVNYNFEGGQVTRQLGATVVDYSVWTKRLSNTQAKLYAKNIAGAGKVQLMLNGSEVAWVDAIDANDPKLRKANSAHYLVRTVNLKSGKNVLEIWVDGVRERRTVYTR